MIVEFQFQPSQAYHPERLPILAVRLSVIGTYLQLYVRFCTAECSFRNIFYATEEING